MDHTQLPEIVSISCFQLSLEQWDGKLMTTFWPSRYLTEAWYDNVDGLWLLINR